METNFLTLKQVCDMLHVSRPVITSLIVGGKIKAVKIGNCWRIQEDDLNAYIKKRTTRLINH